MTLTTTIQTYLSQAATSEFRGLEVTVVDHWEGRDNLLWRVHAGGEDAVLKLFLDAGQARSRRQFDGQQHGTLRNIAPQPLWYDRYPEGLSRQIMVYRWAPGETLMPTDSGQMNALAQAVAAIHVSDPETVGRFSPNPINLDYLWRLLAISTQKNVAWLRDLNLPALAAQMAQLGDAAEALVVQTLSFWQGTPPAPIHGDLRIENVVHGPLGCMLLDWEMFGLGDPAQEVAQFLEMSRHAVAPDQQEAWLEGYLAAMDLPGLEVRIGVYRRILAYRAVCFLLDGLRELSADDQELAAHGQDMPFFEATLIAAVHEATQKLAARDVSSSDIKSLFTALN